MNSCLVFREPRGFAELGELSAVPEDLERYQRKAASSRNPVRQMMQSSDEPVDAKTERPKPFVLIHCHGNATDVGLMMSAYWELSKQLGVDVVGVEYSGYGQASGSPSP